MVTPQKASQRMVPVDEPEATERTEKIHAVDGTLAFEVGPNGQRPGVRIKTHLPTTGGTLSIPLDEDAAQAMALAILATAPDGTRPAPQDAQQPPQDRSGDALGTPGGVTGSQGLGEALRAMRERAEDATEGPWEETATKRPDGSIYYSVDATWDGLHDGEVAVLPHTPQGSEDTAFIAHARTDVPALVKALEAVLAIHEPYEHTNRRGTHVHCEGCEANSQGEYSTDYPCPTVTAIETALDAR